MGRFGRLASSLTLAIFLGDAAHADAAEPSATATRPGAPTAAKPPPNDPRRGPRLEYNRGPTECLSEDSFRNEVAVILDSIDHFDVTSRDVASVKFEKIADGYRGTLVYTNAGGEQATPMVKTYYNCEILGRWVAGPASGLIPGPPKGLPVPAATSVSSAVPSSVSSAAPSSVPIAAPSSVPSAVPSSAPSAEPAPRPGAWNTLRAIPLCIPSATSRGVLMTFACVGTTATVLSGAAAIGLEIHFQSLRATLFKQGYQPDTCSKPGAPKECADLRSRASHAQEAGYATITAAVATGVLTGATLLAFTLDRDPSLPSIALTVGPQGGGIGLIGMW